MEQADVIVVGGGPAGLFAAETAAGRGMRVAIHDAMPSVGRKLLVAGRGGLNLTHGEDFDRFVSRYSGPEMPDIWRGLLEDFSPAAIRAWAAELGIETFEQRTGRVYPKEMKAAPLLRRWIARLKEAGVVFHMNRRWCGIEAGSDGWVVRSSDGSAAVAKAVVFAMGGGSWPRTGSDGNWLRIFRETGVLCNHLRPANCGWEVEWPEETLAAAEGKPVKNIRVTAGSKQVDGELLITRYGLEGGAIYALGAELRTMETPELVIDFKPSFNCEQLVNKFGSCSFSWGKAKQVWRLSDAAAAIVSRRQVAEVFQAADSINRFKIRLIRPRPLAEAISSAGGVCWRELDGNLMLVRLPGVFVAGEMIDWEAPTGGYLMQGCFATGRRAGAGAAKYVIEESSSRSPA